MDGSTRFIVVDDYSNIRNMLKLQIGEMGFTSPVQEAEDVDKGIAKLEELHGTENQIQFIVSDWNMPNKTGLDFLKFVRASDKFKDLPFLILTTESEQAKVMSAVTSGVSNFLLKPWEQEELSEKIKQCWDKHN
jgi:two-component system chemotaxis response regulator CheY